MPSYAVVPKMEGMSTTTLALLKRLREVHQLSQTEISRLTGIGQPKLSRWEGGAIGGAADEALKLAALVAQFDRKAKRKGA